MTIKKVYWRPVRRESEQRIGEAMAAVQLDGKMLLHFRADERPAAPGPRPAALVEFVGTEFGAGGVPMGPGQATYARWRVSVEAASRREADAAADAVERSLVEHGFATERLGEATLDSRSQYVAQVGAALGH